MVLIEPICEHVLHEEVNLINGVEFLDILTKLVLRDPSEVSVPGFSDIEVLMDIIQLSLLPPVLDVPIKFPICSIFDLFLIF